MSKQTYSAFKQKVEHEQNELSSEEIKELMKKRSEFILELDNLTPQPHNWVDRGLVMSCEGAAHPNHRAFKRRIGKRAGSSTKIVDRPAGSPPSHELATLKKRMGSTL